jgi:DNA-directed RNA polymerase specialized sigma24 family protein
LLDWLMRNGRRERLCSDLAAATGAPSALVEDALQDACLIAASPGRCRGASEGEVYNWLRATTLTKIRDLGQLAHRRHEFPVGLDQLGEAWPRAASAGADVEAIRREKQRELAELARQSVARMTERQRQVVALHSQCVRGREIAKRLGTSERRVKRLKEHAYGHARAALVEAAGGGCKAGKRLVSRLSFGTATASERARANAHLHSCRDCLALYRRLELFHEKIAALLPVPAMVQADPGLLERTVHKTTAALAHAKHQLADTGGQLKQHTAAGYTRAVEYTPLATVRPGAAATAIAGCLALGGGAAGYCIDRGVDPVTGLVDVIQPAPAQPAQPPPEQKPPEQQPPDPSQLPPVAQQPAPPPPQPAPAPSPQPAAAPQQPAPPPAPPPEPTPAPVQFGEPATTAQAVPSSPPPSAQPAQPAPTPQSGGTDLYGP